MKILTLMHMLNPCIRMKRSQSTSSDLDESPESEFRRGGVRATAGPRLGWSRDLQRSNNKYIEFVC